MIKQGYKYDTLNEVNEIIEQLNDHYGYSQNGHTYFSLDSFQHFGAFYFIHAHKMITPVLGEPTDIELPL